MTSPSRDAVPATVRCASCTGRGVRFGASGRARACSRCGGTGSVCKGTRNPPPPRRPIQPVDTLRREAERALGILCALARDAV